MAIGLAALGLLAFLLGCSGTFAEPQNSDPAEKCSLTGIWKSGMGNIVEIFRVNETGLFSGTIYVYWLPPPFTESFHSPLKGIQNLESRPTLAFTSNFPYGTTIVFVGQCLVDVTGKEQLRTTWVMFEKMFGSAKENWMATRVGRSTFLRIE